MRDKGSLIVLKGKGRERCAKVLSLSEREGGFRYISFPRRQDLFSSRLRRKVFCCRHEGKQGDSLLALGLDTESC